MGIKIVNLGQIAQQSSKCVQLSPLDRTSNSFTACPVLPISPLYKGYEKYVSLNVYLTADSSLYLSMNALYFCMRIIFGCFLVLSSLVHVWDSHGHLSGILGLLAGAIILLPVWPVLSGEQKLLPVSSIRGTINERVTLKLFRRAFGALFITGSVASLELEATLSSLPVLFLGLILITPLDTIVFEWERCLLPASVSAALDKNAKTGIVVLRNMGLYLIWGSLIPFSFNSDLIKLVGGIMLLIGLSMMFFKPLTTLLKYQRPSFLLSFIMEPFRLKAIKDKERPTIDISQPTFAAGKAGVNYNSKDAINLSDDINERKDQNTIIKSKQGKSTTDTLSVDKSKENGGITRKDTCMTELTEEYLRLLMLDGQARGYAFQNFLNRFFSIYNLAPRTAFRLTGEEIDGSFELDSHIYLVEAKWQTSPSAQKDLLIFNGKVEGKSMWARGIFISHSGFSKDGLMAFAHGKRTSIIGLDGQDILSVLQGQISLVKAIKEKARRAAETNDFFVPIKDLIKYS